MTLMVTSKLARITFRPHSQPVDMFLSEEAIIAIFGILLNMPACILIF
jgi:hypothetical protein